MTILDEAQKIQSDAKTYLDSLGIDFLNQNKNKSVVVFPYKKEHVIVDDPVEANKVTKLTKYQDEVAFIFNL